MLEQPAFDRKGGTPTSRLKPANDKTISSIQVSTPKSVNPGTLRFP